MTLQTIIDDYNNREQNYKIKKQNIEMKIARLQAKKNSLERKRPYIVQNIIVPLAKVLKERLGLKAYEIYGPFGIECETSIYLSNDGKNGHIKICDVETWSLTLRWTYGKYGEVEKILYWTGKVTNEFAKGTIGELNGMNNVYAPLPNDIEEIVKILRHTTREEK